MFNLALSSLPAYFFQLFQIPFRHFICVKLTSYSASILRP
ncbi:hypothetical protein HMPREF0454_03343 [Hafnia alvei ATCC 51873]|uniref:Uncharacterized protein n=1 Tax=Hafnia alvei ATCC 51873 TaxID=1002364 RepID=G9Y9S4_HAFAL|nr:hypothetical protein HMPREF0454_03343 [Hafnia alvei ATCC 51873]